MPTAGAAAPHVTDRSAHVTAIARQAQAVASLISTSRLLQLPLSPAMILAQCVHVVLFASALWPPSHQASGLGERQGMPIVLGPIEVVVISKSLVMVSVGGYEASVSLWLAHPPGRPEWLGRVKAGVLEVKPDGDHWHLLHPPAHVHRGGCAGWPAVLLAGHAGPGGHHRRCLCDCPTLTRDGGLRRTIIILSAIGIAWTDQLMDMPHPAAKADRAGDDADAASAPPDRPVAPQTSASL